jgi:hypothetical protein
VVVIDCELGVITIVGRSRVWLQMPMRRRPGMVGIGLVEMLWRQRRQGEIRHQNQADHRAAEGTLHFGDYGHQ